MIGEEPSPGGELTCPLSVLPRSGGAEKQNNSIVKSSHRRARLFHNHVMHGNGKEVGKPC